jgi:Secretion system C-terminal sorting domain
MKKVLLTILFLTTLNYTYSQRWEHIYGNPGTTEAPGDVIESYDKGYIVSCSHEEPQGAWIFKTSINGEKLWDKLFVWENTLVYGGEKIDQDHFGNIIIASNIDSEENGHWPMLIKLDTCGEKVWCRVFPQSNYDFANYRDILALNNGDYLALGHFESFEYPDQVYLDYVDKNGSLLWRKAYAKEDDYPLIASPSAKGLFKHGSDYYIYGKCYWPYPDNPSHVYLRPMFISIDSAFNENWILPFGVSDSLCGVAKDMININDSMFMSVGTVYKGSEIVSLLSYFDKDGNEIGFKKIPNETFGSEITDCIGKKIEKINDSLYIVLGSWGNIDDWYEGKYITDTSGNIYDIQSNQSTGGGREIIKNENNNFIIGIGFKEGKSDYDVLLYKIDENLESVPYNPAQFTYDSLCPYQISSGTVDISDCMVMVNTEETPTPEQYYASLKTIPIKAFPNPAKEMITFALQNTDKHKNIRLECYDIFGRQVHEQKIYTGQLEAEANVSAWRSGMYVTVVKSNGKIVGKGSFVVE